VYGSSERIEKEEKTYGGKLYKKEKRWTIQKYIF
jgi:hypothetical protein